MIFFQVFVSYIWIWLGFYFVVLGGWTWNALLLSPAALLVLTYPLQLEWQAGCHPNSLKSHLSPHLHSKCCNLWATPQPVNWVHSPSLIAHILGVFLCCEMVKSRHKTTLHGREGEDQAQLTKAKGTYFRGVGVVLLMFGCHPPALHGFQSFLWPPFSVQSLSHHTPRGYLLSQTQMLCWPSGTKAASWLLTWEGVSGFGKLDLIVCSNRSWSGETWLDKTATNLCRYLLNWPFSSQFSFTCHH